MAYKYNNQSSTINQYSFEAHNVSNKVTQQAHSLKQTSKTNKFSLTKYKNLKLQNKQANKETDNQSHKV